MARKADTVQTPESLAQARDEAIAAADKALADAVAGLEAVRADRDRRIAAAMYECEARLAHLKENR